MTVEQDRQKMEPVFSKRVRAGRRRTYFFDVRTTRSNDYYLTITESKKMHDDEGYERHKIFLYKEDFNKFMDALNETVEKVKTDLLPEYDFDEFTHDHEHEGSYEFKEDLKKVENKKEEESSEEEKKEDNPIEDNAENTEIKKEDTETEEDEPLKFD